MVYPRHWLLRFEGSFRTSTTASSEIERWSVGIRCLVGEPPIDEQAILDANAQTWMSLLVVNSHTGALTYGDTVKLNEIAPDGKYAQDTTYFKDLIGVSTLHGSASRAYEPQRTLAVSWTTGAARGLAHRGRIYLPGFSLDVDSSYGISTSGPMTAAKALLDSIQATAVLEPAVVSGVRTGAARVITGIEIGNRVDTQRRRRRSLQEMYGTGPA